MNKPKIVASLMCMDFFDIKHQMEVINEELDGFHCDIMDGHFCKNITLSPSIIKACMKANVSKPADVHLMTTNPSDWIELCVDAGCSIVSPHAETINTDAFRTLNLIKSLGAKCGVTLNPATPLSYCQQYLNRIDVLTIMTVDVGFAGQPFIEEMLDKIREAKQLREENGYHYEIMIDGSCNKKTYKRLYEAGADIFVVGTSGLFSLDSDIKEACRKLKVQFEEETGVKL